MGLMRVRERRVHGYNVIGGRGWSVVSFLLNHCFVNLSKDSIVVVTGRGRSSFCHCSLLGMAVYGFSWVAAGEGKQRSRSARSPGLEVLGSMELSSSGLRLGWCRHLRIAAMCCADGCHCRRRRPGESFEMCRDDFVRV
jgi:hypothetical protein